MKIITIQVHVNIREPSSRLNKMKKERKSEEVLCESRVDIEVDSL